MATLKVNDVLAELRISHKMSLKQVAEKTSFSDTRLSRLEKGSANCTLLELKELCDLYGISLIELLRRSGILKDQEIQEAQQCFDDVYLLDSEDRAFVQSIISYLAKRRKPCITN